MDNEDPSSIARRLNSSQKKALNAASTKPKSWATIMRHAKIPRGKYVGFLVSPFLLIRGQAEPRGRYKYYLTPLGAAVRDIVKQIN